jgi:hypothetical protein
MQLHHPGPFKLWKAFTHLVCVKAGHYRDLLCASRAKALQSGQDAGAVVSLEFVDSISGHERSDRIGCAAKWGIQAASSSSIANKPSW